MDNSQPGFDRGDLFVSGLFSSMSHMLPEHRDRLTMAELRSVWLKDFGSRLKVFAAPQPRAVPRTKRFFHELVDCPPILGNDLHPRQAAHLREVDSTKTDSCDEDVDAIAQWLMIECRLQCFSSPRAASSTIFGHVSSASPRATASAWRSAPLRPRALSAISVPGEETPKDAA